jgi:hypothetical protein
MVNQMSLRTITILGLFALFSWPSDSPAREPNPKKLQVFILAGQSNMEGHGNFITIPRLFVDEREEVNSLSKLVFKPGKVVTRTMVDDQIAPMIARNDLNNAIRKKEITDPSDIAVAKKQIKVLSQEYKEKSDQIKEFFAVSDRVYISSIAGRNKRNGPLTIGYGASTDEIGPELGFGMSMAQRIDSPILLIKAAWGGKSLHYNFRPPSAGPYELSEKELASDKADQIKKDVSLNYRLMQEHVQSVLENIEDHHPQYDASAGYEIAGFVWFQGFNDQFSDPFRDNYASNMVNFIKDVRKEYDVPKMPFIIGVLGTGVTAEKVAENKVSLGQRAAATTPEFKGNVAAVESYKVWDHSAYEVYKKGWADHFAEWCAVGSDRPYHYLGSGKFFVRLGDRFAESMHSLIELQK